MSTSRASDARSRRPRLMNSEKGSAEVRHDVLYLAVVPWYRSQCVDILLSRRDRRISIYAADYGLDPSVRTGIAAHTYRRVWRRALAGGRLLVTGVPMSALSADACVIDLNPRSMSAWIVLGIRRLLGRRVVVWGHLYPRAGENSRTAALRRAMRRLADGAILYDYASQEKALTDIPAQPVWTAPNALYKSTTIGAGPVGRTRKDLIYVGRLVDQKKVDQLVPAFAESGLWREGYRLRIIGDGTASELIDQQITQLPAEVAAYVSRGGVITDTAQLEREYSTAICSLSPGYVGLSATQSLGFGVPMIFSVHEPHAPEIELAATGAMYGYTDSSVSGLAASMSEAVRGLESAPEHVYSDISSAIAGHYSAESMAKGIVDALEGARPASRESALPTVEVFK